MRPSIIMSISSAALVAIFAHKPGLLLAGAGTGLAIVLLLASILYPLILYLSEQGVRSANVMLGYFWIAPLFAQAMLLALYTSTTETARSAAVFSEILHVSYFCLSAIGLHVLLLLPKVISGAQVDLTATRVEVMTDKLAEAHKRTGDIPVQSVQSIADAIAQEVPTPENTVRSKGAWARVVAMLIGGKHGG